jgi:hypothetical protein
MSAATNAGSFGPHFSTTRLVMKAKISVAEFITNTSFRRISLQSAPAAALIFLSPSDY